MNVAASPGPLTWGETGPISGKLSAAVIGPLRLMAKTALTRPFEQLEAGQATLLACNVITRTDPETSKPTDVRVYALAVREY